MRYHYQRNLAAIFDQYVLVLVVQVHELLAHSGTLLRSERVVPHSSAVSFGVALQHLKGLSGFQLAAILLRTQQL